MRWDSTSGSYDMGFRNYDPGINQFASRDMYDGATQNMGLTTDPFTGSLYAFGNGNPVSNIELDGHMACADGTSDCSVQGGAQWAPKPAPASTSCLGPVLSCGGTPSYTNVPAGSGSGSSASGASGTSGVQNGQLSLTPQQIAGIDKLTLDIATNAAAASQANNPCHGTGEICNAINIGTVEIGAAFTWVGKFAGGKHRPGWPAALERGWAQNVREFGRGDLAGVLEDPVTGPAGLALGGIINYEGFRNQGNSIGVSLGKATISTLVGAGTSALGALVGGVAGAAVPGIDATGISEAGGAFLGSLGGGILGNMWGTSLANYAYEPHHFW
jgi:RHS repeat-associated protein